MSKNITINVSESIVSFIVEGQSILLGKSSRHEISLKDDSSYIYLHLDTPKVSRIMVNTVEDVITIDGEIITGNKTDIASSIASAILTHTGVDFSANLVRWINIDNQPASSTLMFTNTDVLEPLLLVGDRNNDPSTSQPFQAFIETGKGSLDVLNNMLDIEDLDFKSSIECRVSVTDAQGGGGQRIALGIRLIFDKSSYLASPSEFINFVDVSGTPSTIPNGKITSEEISAYHGGIEAIQILASGTLGESVIFDGCLFRFCDVVS